MQTQLLKLLEAIQQGAEELLTDEQAAGVLKVAPNFIIRHRAELVRDGAEIYQLPSTSDKNIKPRYRWKRSSLLKLPRGLNSTV